MDNVTYRSGSALRFGGAAFAAAALCLPLAVASCSAKQERLVTTKTVVREEVVRAVPPPKTVDITIVDLHDEPALDPTKEKVVGTIVNDGDRQVSGLSIRVDALDGAGRVVTSVTTPPLAHTIDANGGRATFEAFVPKDSAVTQYYAVAIAR